MSVVDSPRNQRTNYIIILAALLAVFAAALTVFMFLIRQGGAPRVELPNVLPQTSSRASFDRDLVDVSRPKAVAASPDGSRIYAAEGAGDYLVRVIDTKTGEVTGSAVPPHTEQGNRQPMDVAVAPDGSVYVTERLLRQVLVYEPDGTFREPLTPEGVELWAPLGVTVGPDGLVYVANAYDMPDQTDHRIYVLNPDGTVVRSFGQKGAGSSELMFPKAVAVDGLGRIWVADITGVKIFDSGGTFVARLPMEGDSGVTLPGGIESVGDEVYITDITNHRVLVYDASGDPPTFDYEFGEMGTAPKQLRYPEGIAAASDHIYIANRENGRIDIWKR